MIPASIIDFNLETFEENVVTIARPLIFLIALIKLSATLLSVSEISFLNIFVESHTKTSHPDFPIFSNFLVSVLRSITGFSSSFQSAE